MSRNSFRLVSHAFAKVAGRFAAVAALALLILPSSAVQAATPGLSPAEAVQNDGVIEEQVYDALNIDPTFYFRHVDVHVQHGVVTLTGFVWSTSAIYRAEKIASGVPGVTRVVDKMELERNGLVPHA
jgi:osmotically-inducible protein OsmY